MNPKLINNANANPDFTGMHISEIANTFSAPGDEEEIVNEQEQNEVVNEEEADQTTNGNS